MKRKKFFTDEVNAVSQSAPDLSIREQISWDVIGRSKKRSRA